MNALILTCGTGGGHNSACRALDEELTLRGHCVKTLNPYLLKGEKTAKTIDDAYIGLVQKVPSAFGMVYRLGNAYRKMPVSSPVYHLNRLMVPCLEEYLQENPCDAVITTHLFPAEILTNMKRLGKKIPKTFFIATDYTCIPFTEETDCDFYIIPAKELTEEFIERGVPREKLVPLGIPVARTFYEPVDSEKAKARLGLQAGKTYLLLAGGSIGAGQIEQIIPLLLARFEKTAKLIVICGSNPALYRNLEPEYGEKCILLQFTTNIAEYMRACSLYLTKPGGLSSTEAAAMGTALIHITPIPGCETCNMEFFSKNGMSLAVSSPKKQLTEACDTLLEKEAREKMIARQRKIIPRQAASAICDFLEREAVRCENE